jgi:hypothetical protein
LNAAFDRHHDRYLASLGADGLVTAVRYSDDLTCVTRSLPDGMRILRIVREMLRVLGLSIKVNTGIPTDIRDEPVQVLGFNLRAEGESLTFTLGDKAWVALDMGLDEAHFAENPSANSLEIVRGWVGSLGPVAFTDKDVARANTVLVEQGFPPVPCGQLRLWHREAVKRWETKCKCVRITRRIAGEPWPQR